MKTKINNIAGFSLIELLFAIVFLSVVIVGIMKLQTSNVILGNTQQNQLKAHFYAIQALEIVESLPFSAIDNCGDVCYLTENGGGYDLGNAVEPLDEGLFERRLVKNQEGLMSKSAYVVTAEVAWTDSSGPHVVSAKRVVFD